MEVHSTDDRPVHVTLFGHDHRYEVAWANTDDGPVVVDLRITSDAGVPITSKGLNRIKVERLAEAAALHDTSKAAKAARDLRAALEVAIRHYADPEAAVSDACNLLDATGDPDAADAAAELLRASRETGAAAVIADALDAVERRRFTADVIRALADRRPDGASHATTAATNVGGRPPKWTRDFLGRVAEWAREADPLGGSIYERVAERAEDHLGESVSADQVKHWIKQAKRANLLELDELRQPRGRQETATKKKTTTAGPTTTHNRQDDGP